MAFLDNTVANSPQLWNGAACLGILTVLYYTLTVFPIWVQKVRLWRKYCASHSRFSLEAGQGRYLWLEDPFSRAWTTTTTLPPRYSVLTVPSQRHETTGSVITPPSNMSSAEQLCQYLRLCSAQCALVTCCDEADF